MCTQNQLKAKQGLTKADFIIPEDWEPDTPIVKRLRELREQVVGILGPDAIQEILREFGVISEHDEKVADEFSSSRR